MEQQIRAKYNELKAIAPAGKEFRTWLSESNLWGWLYTDYIIQGQKVSRAAVADMCSGVIRGDVPLANYAFAERCKTLHSDMQADISMHSAPSLKLFKRWMNILFDDISYRKTNPVVYEYGLIPCHFHSIDEELDRVFREYIKSEADPVDALAMLFLNVLKVYPYEEESVDAAMAVMLYCFETMEIPVPEFSANEEEFGTLVKDYMDKGQSKPFRDMFKRSVYNRLDAVVNLAKQAKEND